MKNLQKVTSQFSQKLQRVNQDNNESFVDKILNLSKTQVTIIAKCLGNNIVSSHKLKSRKLFIKFSQPDDFEIKTSKISKESVEVIFYQYFLQSTTSLYLIAVSNFDIYKVLEKEPFQEARGEYQYQVQLAKALGLKNAVAYDVPRNYQLNIDSAVNEDLELLYCNDDKLSYLVYCL